MSASDSAASAASATDESPYRGHPLAGALAFRRSVAALFSFGLRFPVICNGESAVAELLAHRP
jgi:hypothetical protein